MPDAMGVTPGTATSMAKHLHREGLIEYLPRRGTILSDSGRNRLNDDLGLLESCRQLPMSWPRQARVLVVRGLKDAVVSAAGHQQLVDALSNQTIQVHCDPSSGHALITPQVLGIVEQWLQIP